MVDLKAYYKNLAYLFSGGGADTSIARQRIANKVQAPGQVGMPVGTAKAFLRHANSAYTTSLAQYGQYSRMARYSDYSEMESSGEISKALDIYADEITTRGENGKVIDVKSSNARVQDILNELFIDVLNIEYNSWYWVRNMCKYGDQFLMIDHHPDYGVMNLLSLPINEIEREEGFDPENPLDHRFRWITQGNRVIDRWMVVHFRSIGNDNFAPYGSSLIEPARRIWRQLILMEDAVMVYRIVRSPERRVFYIDVGNVDPKDIPAFMEKAKSQLKRNQIVDNTTGRVDQRYNVLSTEEDYWIPLRGDRSSRIETLPGGQYTGDVDDLVYLQNKLFAALGIPKSYLGYEGDVGSQSTLSQQDLRFSRTIQRLQRTFIGELNKIALVHLYSIGYRGQELFDFEINMANPSMIAELQRLELWRTKFEVSSMAIEGMFDKNFIYDTIWKLTPEEIEGIERGRKKDAKFELDLQNIQAAPVDMRR